MLAPTRTELVAERCRRSLRYFAEEAWPLVEPAVPFVGNWHIDVICEHLEAVSRREIRRLIINIPPRCMKSLTVAVFWPCWEWLERPETRWLFASYAEHLSHRDSLKCRRLIKTQGIADGRDRGVLERIGYQGMLRVLHGEDAWEITKDQDAKRKFDNTRFGYRLATSVGGTATGEGGDIVCVDDPHKADEAESDTVREGVLGWHDSTIPTRFNQPKRSAEVLIMQRLHEQDLTGHLLEQAGWEHLCLPMEYEPTHQFAWPRDPRREEGELLWSERIGREELVTMSSAMGGYRAAGQLQQRPAPAEGLLFKSKHFRRWRIAESQAGALTVHTYLLEGEDGETLRVEAGRCRVFQTTDIAASEKQTSDFTVVATWALTPERKLLLLDVERQHFDVLDVSGFLVRKQDEWSNVPQWIEVFGAGKGPHKQMVRLARNVHALQPEHGTQLDKIARAWPAVAAYEAHDVFHPVESDAVEWLPKFEQELLAFPNGRNDDQVDSVSYACRLRDRVAVGKPRPQSQDVGPKPWASGIRGEQF